VQRKAAKSTNSNARGDQKRFFKGSYDDLARLEAQVRARQLEGVGPSSKILQLIAEINELLYDWEDHWGDEDYLCGVAMFAA